MRTLPSSDKLRRGAAAVAFFLMVGSSQQVRATEESEWAFLGFSAEGDYAAVELFGVHDDGASPFSLIRIIDIKANRFAEAPIWTCIGPGCEEPKNASPTTKEARTRNRQKARDALARFRIDANVQGERTKLSAKQRTSANQASGAAGMAQETAQFRWMNTEWTLVLQEVPAPKGADGGHGTPRMLDLRLQRNGNELTLQKDRSIPKSRGVGIYAYELDTVLTYRSSLLVVVRHMQAGHEGPDTSQMFITAEVH
jgi:predicted secreted protein